MTKSLFLFLILFGYSQFCLAIFGSKTTGKIVKSANDKPVLKPADGDYSIKFNKNRKFVPYDHQESEFAKFVNEEASNLIERNDKDLCESANQDFLFLFRSADNFMRAAVPNFKGPLGTGVCWWLTDFQFNFLFLTYANPRISKPNFEVKKTIVEQIITGTKVSELSGYKSLEEFMQDEDVQRIIKSKISNKYLVDSFIKLRWANRKPSGATDNMQKEYEKIDSFLKTNNLPAPLYLDLEGLPSHALIALKTTEFPSQKTQADVMFHVLDSNPVPAYLSYRRTTQKFIANMSWLSGKMKFDKQGNPIMNLHEPKVFLDRPERYQNLKEILDQFCKSKGFSKGARLLAPK